MSLQPLDQTALEQLKQDMTVICLALELEPEEAGAWVLQQYAAEAARSLMLASWLAQREHQVYCPRCGLLQPPADKQGATRTCPSCSLSLSSVGSSAAHSQGDVKVNTPATTPTRKPATMEVKRVRFK